MTIKNKRNAHTFHVVWLLTSAPAPHGLYRNPQFCDRGTTTFARAVNIAKANGFDSSIYGPKGVLLASWDPVGGLKKYL